MEKANLVFLHGSRGLDEKAKIEIKESKKGKFEHGAGFYLTTSYDTARKYARNSNQVWEIHLEDPVLLTGKDKLPLEDVLDFVHSQSRLKGKSRVFRDIEYSLEKSLDKSNLSILTFLNILVDNQCLTGAYGVNFSKWLVTKGFDAVAIKQSQEDWLVVFNPKKITSINVLKGYDDKPLLTEQYKMIEEQEVLRKEMPDLENVKKMKI